MAAPDPARLAPGLDFLLSRLRAEAPEPMLVAYVPNVPRLRDAKILRHDPDAPTAKAVRQACARNGVAFLDMGPIFLRHFQETGRFPRGFFNSPPGQGHLNEDGHRLVAEAVLRHLKEHRDALLAP